MKTLVEAMRPKQWAKNVFVFAGLFFDGRVFDTFRLGRSVAAFVIFCLLSGAVYLVNDLVDIEKDRLHPRKRLRPLASGRLKPSVARVAATICFGAALGAAFALDRGLGAVAALYVATMLLYSASLKNLVIIDVMAIAAGFVLRVLAGSLAAQVTRFSPWLYVCTTLLALFIAINKRRHEMVLLQEAANGHRASLQEYTIPFLDEMTSLVTATTLTAYCFYTFTAPNLPPNHAMMLTIPFVFYGVFRYLYLIHTKGQGGAPEEIVFKDRPLLVGILLWIGTAALVIYWPW